MITEIAVWIFMIGVVVLGIYIFFIMDDPYDESENEHESGYIDETSITAEQHFTGEDKPEKLVDITGDANYTTKNV